jgi:hypothetical protein
MPASRTLIIRYRTRPDAAEENSRLVAGVFDALAERQPSNFAYTTYRLTDRVSFVHIARFDADENPLAALPAFAEFQRDLAHRCVEPPAPNDATVIGSYQSTEQPPAPTGQS